MKPPLQRAREGNIRHASSSKPPKGWPPKMSYLREPVHSSTLTSSQVISLHCQGPPPGDALQTQAVQAPPPVQIRNISCPSHPAHGQQGLFAIRHLAPSSFILPYIGYVHGQDDTDETSDYDISLDREAGLSVDAARMGNEARFINDYRGVNADGPNAEFKDCWIPVSSTGPGRSWEKCIGVYVLSAGKSGKRAKGIAKGEEILVSYGRGFWQERASDGDGGGELSNMHLAAANEEKP